MRQLYERVHITTIRYIFPTIRIVGRILQMYTDLQRIKISLFVVTKGQLQYAVKSQWITKPNSTGKETEYSKLNGESRCNFFVCNG